jgi:PAS domain S-box-containing protein
MLSSKAAERASHTAALEQAMHAANERAAAAERQLAEMQAQATAGQLLVGAGDTIMQLSESLCQLLGGPEPAAYWPGQPAGAWLARLQQAVQHPAQYATRLRAQRAARQPLVGERLRLQDGRELVHDYRLLPAPGGAAPHELFTYRLATAPGSEVPGDELLRVQLLSSFPAAVAVHDMQGVLLACNEAFAQLLQWPAQYLPGCQLSDFVLKTDLAQVWPAYLAEVATDITSASGQLAVQARDGQVRHLLCQAHRLEQPGRATQVMLCAFDISARVEAKAALRQSKEKAEASARAKEAFLANLSHEIRTPMNGVLGMARQLGKTRLDQDQRKWLRILESSGEHLLSVLNEVLDMTKISAARLELEQQPFDLREVLEEVLSPLAVQAAEKGLTLHPALLLQAGPLPQVLGDAHRLKQVIINLVSNAIKFTLPQGSITVGGYVLSQTGTHLTASIRITDTGIGIAPDKLDFIFEDFVQASTDTARRFGGTGLGLGIARALVEQMGGTLTVNSQLGHGSTFQFSVTLPWAVDVAPAPRPVLTDTGALRQRRVLVAEDNGINREVVRLLLHSWGVVVDEAEDGPGALALHAERTYDAVLMDIQMPGMSGVEATAHLRLHPDPERAQVPVLALTANAFRSDVERYLAAGINDCLTKPFREDALYHKLVALIQAPPPPLYNLRQVHELADNEPIFVERVVRSFLTHMPGALAQLEAAATAGQWPQVAQLVHHIKPNLEQFGVAGITQPLRLLKKPPAPGASATTHGRAVHLLVQQIRRVLEVLPQALPTT